MHKPLFTGAASRTTRAVAFAHVADEYERGRPGYPPEAIAWLPGPEPLERMRAILAERLPAATVLASLDLLWEREPELRGHTEVQMPWLTHVRRCRRVRFGKSDA